MKKTFYIIALALLGLTSCDYGDPFNGQGARQSAAGVSDATLVEVEKAYYDNTLGELHLYWKPVAQELDASFIGTEFVFTTHSGVPLTSDIMRDKNFPQAYDRVAIATKQPSKVSYRSIWRNEKGERIYSNYQSLEGTEIETVELGPEVTFTNMQMPQWFMYDPLEGTPESDLYYKILGNPPYPFFEHQLKVICGAMWFNDKDPYVKIQKLQCEFKPSEYVAYVTWDGDKTIMCVSQGHVKGMLNGNFEAGREELVGVCYHELTHTMQKPLKSGSKHDNGCYVEGGADASRLICGGFSDNQRLTSSKAAVNLPEDNPNADGVPHPWLEQYTTSGFFIAWLRRYDGDFWRKFNYTSQILTDNDWTFESAVKLIFADNQAVANAIAEKDCQSDILRGLWRIYKEDVEREQISE